MNEDSVIAANGVEPVVEQDPTRDFENVSIPAQDEPIMEEVINIASAHKSTLIPASPSMQVPPAIPGYEFLDVIGNGAMGVVWRVRQTGLGNRIVAVKVIRPESLNDAKRIARFAVEGVINATLRHPNVVQVFGGNVTDDTLPFYIVMEFVKGEDLESLLRRGPVSVARGLDICKQAALGLGEAHQQNIVHRDVKPANLLLSLNGRVQLGDFGLSRTFQVDSAEDGQFSLCGTPAYMAPEQVRSERQDHRSDIYSLGAVLYRLLTGSIPFPAKSRGAVHLMQEHLHTAVPSARDKNPAVPIEVDLIIAKAMAKKPEDRFQSCAELVAAIEAVEKSLEPEALALVEARAQIEVQTRALEGDLKVVRTKARRRLIVACLAFLVISLVAVFAFRGSNIATPVKPDSMAIFATEVASVSDANERVTKVLAKFYELNPALPKPDPRIQFSGAIKTILNEDGYTLVFDRGSKVSNWGPISALSNDLVALVAQDCGLSSSESVTALSKCRRLKVLDLSHTGELKSCDKLNALNLGEIYLRDTGVDSLEFLRGKNSLKKLVVINCPLEFDDFLPLHGGELSQLAVSLQGQDLIRLSEAFKELELTAF